MDVSATFQVTEDDLRAVSRQAGGGWRTAAIGVLALALGIIALTAGDEKVAVFPIVFAVALPLVTERDRRRMVKRHAYLISEPWWVRVTQENFEIRTVESHATVQWSAITEARSRADFWLLRHANRTVNFIPQAAFGDGDRARIDAFLTERYPAGKRL